MSRRVSNTGGRRKSSRRNTFLWIAGATIFTIALIYWEQTALLYILATLGVTVLLVLVARADLHGRAPNEPVPMDDSAAIGSGLTSSVPRATATRVSRPAKRR